MQQRILAIAFAVTLGLSLPVAALAASPESSLRPVAITAAPGTISARVSPNPVLITGANETSGHVRIDNISTLVEDISIQVVDYTVTSDGTPVAAPADFAFGSAAWYRFATAAFTLPAGMGLDVPFVLDIPAGAGAGDHFAALRVTVAAHPGQDLGTASGPSATSVLVFQSRLQHRIDGAQPAIPTIALSATTDIGAVHFAASVENTGNTVLGHQAAPTPTLTLYNTSPWGNEATPEKTIEVVGFYVAPESVRDVAIEWLDPPLVGFYRAVFTLPAADGQPEVTAETTLTVINGPVVGAAGVALLVLLLLTILMVRGTMIRGRGYQPIERRKSQRPRRI